MKNDATSSNSTITEEIRVLQSGISAPWGRISELLHQIEKTGFWAGEADSFTRWVNANAQAFGYKPPSLWRIISSGRHYEKFRKEFPQLCPLTLSELPAEVSPENLELLYKLWRVAPKDIFVSLLEKVLSCTVRRFELRSSWVAFRPITEGKTARGTGVDPAKIDVTTGDREERLSEAVIAHRLSSWSPDWTGIKELLFFKYYSARDPYDLDGFDAVAVTRGRMSRLLFHGIKISSRIYPAMLSSVTSNMAKCDLMWVVLPEVPSTEAIEKIPALVGVLVIDKIDQRVVRYAQLPRIANETGNLAKVLLDRELRR